MPIIQMIGMLFNNTLFYITDMYIPSYFLDFFTWKFYYYYYITLYM